ncbi:hypothetical protein GCM10009858_23320 [Terrabacter carboxydivorans]|uniref:Uncharacterized protein n=1 Tax=Terrabacter carboxydivorans TaxID=619730 RepID=A0ABP5YW46_9MICO
MEAAHGHEGAGGGRGGQAPLAQRREEVGDVGLGDAARVVDPLAGEVGGVGTQVAGVGLQRVVRGALLDPDVVEPPADVALEAREPCRGWLGDDLLGQDRACSSETDCMPWASATPA